LSSVIGVNIISGINNKDYPTVSHVLLAEKRKRTMAKLISSITVKTGHTYNLANQIIQFGCG
jgi:hypothetical protein